MKNLLLIGKLLCVFVLLLCHPSLARAQFNVDKLIVSGKVAVYYEDYVLGIQYFNRAIALKPYMWEPWQMRAIAKFNLDDFTGAESDASEAIDLNPYIVQLYDLRGITRIRQDKFEDAIQDYEKAIQLQPTNQNLWYNRAICRLQIKDFEKAHFELDSMIRRWPSYASSYLLKAEVLLQEKDTTESANLIDRSLKVDPYNAEAWRIRAHIHLAREEWKDADQLFSKAIHLKPKTAANYVNRAVARLRLNNLRGAMADYDLAIDLEPTNFLAHYNRGLLRQQVGDDNRAIEDFDYVISLEPDNMMALFNRATLLDRTGNLKAAIRDYSKVIDQFPNFWTGLHYRAGCYRRLGMTAKAEMDEFRILKAQMDKHLGKQPRWSRKKLAEIRKKSEIDPEKYNQMVVEDNVSDGHEYKSEFRGRVQNRRVGADYQPYICLSLNNYNNSASAYHPFENEVESINSRLSGVKLKISTLTNSIEGMETHFSTIDRISSTIENCRDNATLKGLVLARSVLHRTTQNYIDAIADADTYLSIDSTSALAWWQRAICNIRQSEFDKLTSPKEADIRKASIEADFSKAMQLAPDNSFILYCCGTYHAFQQDYAKAIDYLTKAIALDSHLAEAYYNRGLARLQSGDRDGGIADLGKAGELGLYSAYSLIKANAKK